MAIVTIGSILDEIAKYEGSAEQYYIDLRDRACNDGVRLLTHYLARRKRHLPQALMMLDDARLQETRQFQVMVSEDQIPGDQFFQTRRLDDTATGDQLLSEAITITEIPLMLYEKIVEMVPSGPVHGLFRTLSVIEQRAVVELKKIRAMNYF